MIKATIKAEAKTKEELRFLLEQAIMQVIDGDDDLYEKTGDGILEGEVIDTEVVREEWEKKSGYKLSDNQILFCKDADDQGHDIYFNYSGRAMFSKVCPAVNLESRDELETTSKIKEDSMGKGIVLYAQN